MGNDSTASDRMSEGGEVVIAVIGASKSKTEAFVKELGSTECDFKCRQENGILLRNGSLTDCTKLAIRAKLELHTG